MKANLKKIVLQTPCREIFIDITSQVTKLISESKIGQGSCNIYCPHTTAAITVNENADPAVPQDIINQLRQLIPHRANYTHLEGNADAHIKSSLLGTNKTFIIENGRLVLGSWQAIFFAEFDGPRSRKIYLQINGEKG